ncbi:branched-chain-amino-acid aminotransferase, cytosolic-like isoform X1 [Limulus polyphemus]|uniref:Branched-chain-amino-acid aminotransferase n=2 Tax=Limulus polyphemus TaxID=6850 RepID=A0ABM1BB29_LIMPO|nr:branched-chain-amino-acid aminotransferase, cytosolic-like isoform X1 [Limulus polyphemus]
MSFFRQMCIISRRFHGIKGCKVLKLHSRCFSTPLDSFKFADLEIIKAKPSEMSTKPDSNHLIFGRHFSDHMLEVEWTAAGGWRVPRICPVHNLSLHPGAKVLHYAQELFEGMKAFRGEDNKIRLFRPDLNMKRMRTSAERCSFPDFDGKELIKCIRKLISLDQEWVPYSSSSSLYIRPTFIGIEPSLGVAAANRALLFVITGPVGPYFATGVKPVSLLADPKFVRAWPGGVGDKKMGSNYGPTIYIQKHAEKMNLQQVLWIFGEDHQLTEVGTMNIFVLLINEKGEKELVTPPLNGLILPGVTRQSLLDLAKTWNELKVSERVITMKEVLDALKENRLLEIFGSGTACIVCPVNRIHYMGHDYHIPTMEHVQPLNLRFLKTLTDIQYGRIPHKWAEEIEDVPGIHLESVEERV